MAGPNVKLADLTKEQITAYNEAFALFDDDDDNPHFADDLQDVLKSFGHNLSKEEILNMLKTVDADGHGTFDFPGFLSLMEKNMRVADTEPQMRAAFEAFDRHGDGFITADEMRQTMKELGGRVKGDELEALIKEADVKGDGKIVYKDFARIMTKN